MSRLFIALGYPSRKNEALPTVVYAGPDSVALDAALAASPHPVHQILKRPAGGIWKDNPRAAANAAPVAKSEPVVAKSEPVAVESEPVVESEPAVDPAPKRKR